MATNEILTTASVDNGTNLLTQVEYAADVQRPTGQATGVARSKFINKTLRQLSLIAAAVAQFIADRQATNVTDGLAPTALGGMFEQALVNRQIATATGTADAILLALAPTATAFSQGLICFKSTAQNATTTPTIKRDGLTAKPLVKGSNQPVAVADIPAAGAWMWIQYDPVLGKEVLLNPATGVAASGAAAVQGSFKNLKVSATGLSAAVLVTADEIVLEDSSNSYTTQRAVSLSISGVSSGVANGLDTGVLAVSTWYSVWVIWNGTTQAGLLSLSATAPTMPSGYTRKARVGWIRTDSSGNKYPLAFKQFGRKARYVVAAGTNVTVLPVLGSGTATWPTALATANFFPPGVASAICSVYCFLGAASVSFGPSASNQLIQITNSYSSGAAFGQLAEVILESANVYWGCSGSSASGSVAAYGWEDDL